MRPCVGDDIPRRLGGDEFGVLLRRCSIDGAVKIAEKLRLSVEEFRFIWGDKVFQIGVSIGVVRSSLAWPISQRCSVPRIWRVMRQGAGVTGFMCMRHQSDALAHRYGECIGRPIWRARLDEDRFELFVQPLWPWH